MTAVVITRRDARGLAALLDAVLEQSLPPDAVLVLDRSGGAAIPASDSGDDDPTDLHVSGDHVTLDHSAVTVAGVVDRARRRHSVPVTVLPVDPRTPARTAAHRALLDPEVDLPTTTLAWLLPVGTTPEPGALVALVDTWRRSPSAGVVGPKHLDAADPHLLRALAIRTTRGGRLLSRPRPGEPDQGQYDRSTDALGVPFAGSLIERDLLDALRGWEASFGDVGADLDLGWRAHNAGRRVVVVPRARMRTEPGVAPAGATTAARRRSGRRVALARSPWWASPFLAAWIAVTSVVAALGLLLLKRPRAAGAELSSLASLGPIRGTAARWRTRHRREVSRRDLRALFEPRRAVLTGWGDAVHDALVSPRPPIGDEANELNPRSWMLGIARHPGVLATAGALLVSAVAGRSLGFGLVTGAGSGLAGGELMGNRADAQVLWHAWTDGWTGPGLGGPDPAGPWASLLALPTWLVDHVPLLPPPGSAAGLVVALLVILGMPLAAVSAYLALRPVVATRWVRGLAAFGWATTGVAATSVAQGRLGALVALILLPPLACGLWLLAVRRSTATSAFATALAALVLGAFAPVLLALVTVLALVLAVVRSGVRRHALVVAVVPVAVLAPWLVAQSDASWPVLVAGVGLAQWGGPTPEPWQLALLNPGGAGAPLVWTAAPLVAVAVLALLRGRGWGSATTMLALLAPVLLALALLAPGIRLGTVPAGVAGAGEPITLWSGTLLLPLALVVVLAVARGLDGVRLRRPVDAARLPALGRRAGAAVGAAAVAVSACGVAWATLGTELSPWQDPRPAVSVDQAEGAFATRALFVVPGTRGAGYRFVGREASDVARPLPDVDRADGSLAERVSGALGGASSGPSLFADTATDLLAVRSGLAPEVARRLDATDGLQPIAPRGGWDMWRVSPTGTGVDLVAPPRLRLETPQGSRLVSTTGQSAATRTTVDVPPDSRLVVAEPLGWAQHAVVSVDGVTLQPLAGSPTPTYALPVGTGRLTVDVTDPSRWWHVGQALAVLALAFLAVPFGRRESRVGHA
ncbi:MAG: glycosyltransferase [Ornithinibacter sp.]